MVMVFKACQPSKTCWLSTFMLLLTTPMWASREDRLLLYIAVVVLLLAKALFMTALKSMAQDEKRFVICMITLWLTCNFLSSISRQWHHDAVIAHHVMLCISCICHNVGQDICLVSCMKMGPYWVSSGWSIAGAWPEWATGMVSKFVCHPFALALCFNCWTKVAIPLDPTLYSQIFDYHTVLKLKGASRRTCLGIEVKGITWWGLAPVQVELLLAIVVAAAVSLRNADWVAGDLPLLVTVDPSVHMSCPGFIALEHCPERHCCLRTEIA